VLIHERVDLATLPAHPLERLGQPVAAVVALDPVTDQLLGRRPGQPGDRLGVAPGALVELDAMQVAGDRA